MTHTPADPPNDTPTSSAYRDAGVDIDAQERGLARVKKLARSTFTPGVLTEIGSFGGLFRPDLGGLEEPVLVASADGVGTKLRVAARVGDYTTVGRDLVNHCINDILVQGARPLFFLDYLGAGRLDPDAMAQLVEGVAAACKEAGCALLGGETAEMPGFYQEGDYELVGFIVGLVDRRRILDGSRVAPGDVLVGLPSSGLHTNGYSLARKVIFGEQGLDVADEAPWAEPVKKGWGKKKVPTVGDQLLAVHRSYWNVLQPLLPHEGLHGLAHITGGGLTDNLPRVLPKKTHAVVRMGTWEVPAIFHWLQDKGQVDTEEMLRVFNMGVGMVLVVAQDALKEILAALREAGEPGFLLGSVQKGRPRGGSGVIYDVEIRAGDEEDEDEEDG